MDPAVYLSVFALLLTYYIWRRKDSRMSPPGPRPLPLIGNMLDLTAKELWLRVHVWGQKYGQYMLSLSSAIFTSTNISIVHRGYMQPQYPGTRYTIYQQREGCV